MLRQALTSITELMGHLKSYSQCISVIFAALLATSFATSGAYASGYYNVAIGFMSGPPKLSYTTTSQSIYASLCSGVTTVKTLNGKGVVTNVASNLTVNLSATNGVTFYSDSSCTSAITSVTIASGANSASFYFLGPSAGTSAITSTATGYLLASQNETLTTNPFIWTGGGGNANWATAANWSGGAAPGSSDVAVFNGSCVSNCSPSISAALTVGGVRMASDYSGTITQVPGQSITLNSKGWVQLAGTFVGSSNVSDTINANGPVVLVGGSFQSTSGKFYVAGSSYSVSGSMTFLANSGEVVFGYSSNNQSIATGTETYQKVTFGGYGSIFNLNNSTMTIAGDLNLTASGGQVFNTGQLRVAGNVTATGVRNSDTESIILTGNPAGQTLSASSGSIANLEIATGANPVTFNGTVHIQNSYKVTSVGTVTTTGSTLVFSRSFGTMAITPGTIAYNNVQIANYTATTDFGGGTMTINGNLTLGAGGAGDGGAFNNGTLNIAGDLTTTAGTRISGSALFRLVGNAAGQTITSNGTTAGVSNLEIAAGTNNVTFGSTVLVAGNYTLTSVGTLNAAGSTLYFNSDSATIQPGTATYNNVMFTDVWGGSTYSLGSSTFNIGGSLTFNSGGYTITVNSGTLSVAKNVTSSGSIHTGGSASLIFVGSSDQTVTSTGGGTFPTGNVTINTTGGASLVLGSSVSWNGASQSVTVPSGAINQAGYNLTLHALDLQTHSLARNGGTLVVNGSTVGPGTLLLYNGTINP